MTEPSQEEVTAVPSTRSQELAEFPRIVLQSPFAEAPESSAQFGTLVEEKEERSPIDEDSNQAIYQSSLHHGNNDTPMATAILQSQITEEEANTRDAAYLSATVVKSHANMDLKLHVHANEQGRCCIASIDGDSLFSKSRLRVGDFVQSINSIRVEHNPNKARHLLKDTIGAVTIVVENPHQSKNTALVESMVYRSSFSTPVGLIFRSRHGLRVGGIDPDGLFGPSLLKRGDLVLRINNIPCDDMSMDVSSAISLVESLQVVILVAKTEGVVLSRLSSQFAALTGEPLRALQATARRRRRGNEDEDRMCSRKVRVAGELACAVVFGVVIVYFFLIK